jgi:hypothetical protein
MPVLGRWMCYTKDGILKTYLTGILLDQTQFQCFFLYRNYLDNYTFHITFHRVYH